MQQMLKFLYCDTNVTPEMKERVTKLLYDNADKLNLQNPALFLQQLLNKNFEKLWTVYLAHNAVDLEYFIRSNTQILMDLEIETTRYILAQFEEVSIGTFSKDKFNKACQFIEKNVASNPQSLKDLLADAYQYLESQFGSGCHLVLVGEEEQFTQIQYNTPSPNQYTFRVPINDHQSISGTIFYMPLGVEEDDEQHHFHSDLNDQFIQEEHDENYIQDEYEEPMDLLFQVMPDEKEFKQSTDQIKVSFDELEIQPLKVHSFAIIFQIIMSPFPKEIKDDLNVLSTGSSLMSKNITFGVNKDQLFFFNFQMMSGKMETLYSQMKIKRNSLYQVALVYTETEIYKEVSMYVNGAIENQINLSQQIEPPRGFFWIGSEQALKLFKGTLRDIVFVAQPLHQKHIKSVYAELQSALSHKFQRHTIEIVEEVIQQYKEELPIDQDESKFTQTQSIVKQSKTMPKSNSKKMQIPPHLQKSYHVFDEIDKKKTFQTEQQPHQKTQSEFASISNLTLDHLKQEFEANEMLYHKCHELSINFYWVFTTVQQLAPPLEENGNPKLPFEYLHQELFKERFDNYPYYAIEMDRFCKVVQHCGIQLSHEDIYRLASFTDSLRVNKKFGQYIIYDRFLLIIREASLTQQEIEMVQSQYNTDEKEADLDLIIYTKGITRSKQQINHNFSFFEQLKTLVGSENEAFKYNIQHLLAYFVNNEQFVQKLTAVYIHKETGQEVEIEGIDLFSYDQDKIFQQKLDLAEETQPKYFRVHYNNENMAMISFKTHKAEETFMIDKTFVYKEGQDATGQLETCAFDQQRLAGFRGTLIKKDGLSQIIMFAAEYLQKDPQVEEMKRRQPEQLPVLPETWNQGRFQLIINRCSDCDKHNTTTWHQEADFANKFNEIGGILKDMFPNIEVIGNWDKTQQLEHFDVYIRGVGPANQMDREGRVFLFRKNEKLVRFLDNFLKRMLKVYDDIVLIAQAYGDTNELAKKQEQFLKTGNYPPKSKIAHENPCNVPDRVEKSEKGDTQMAGLDFICKNWGCGQPFKYDSTPNGIKTCKHHPGRYEFGSKHGLWPECWTCCGKKWEAEGCRLAYHKGVPEKDFYSVCINVGQLDSRTGFPEGICGMRFQDGDSSECKYNGGTHQAAKWPDPAAKVYFVQKLHTNPAQKEKEQQPKNVQLKPDVFRETKPYNEFINKDRQRQMKLIETEKETRQCINWSCGKQYKEIENRKKRMCKCHPGVFDFGHTATKIQEAIEEYKQEKGSKILWRPHWTCCRKSWNEPGCTLQQHTGPLVTEYKPKQYQWPDPKAQIYFKKKVSENWTRMLSQHHSLTPETASMKYDSLCKSLGSGGQISAYKLPELCDKFELNLWVCSEDLAFQFKFTDIMEGRAQEYLADTSGNVDKHKFLDWWFADVNRMLEISSK